MKYRVYPAMSRPGDWVAGAVNLPGEGEIFLAIFSGPDAQKRAEEYAAWKSGPGPQQSEGDQGARTSTLSMHESACSV
jgi:hypothetical protein